MAGTAAPPPLPRQNWFARHWKWVVPSGCLFLLLAACFFTFAVFLFVSSVIKQSDPYQGAVERAKQNPAVSAAIGTPIREGWLASGNAHVTGSSGQASLAIPVNGPKGEATIYVEANKVAGVWHYTTLVVEIGRTRQRIDLNSPIAAPRS